MIAVNGLFLMQQVVVDEVPSVGAFDHWPTIVGQLVILVTTIAGFLYNIYRENRNRRWDIEDRERVRRDISEKVDQSKRELASATLATHHTLIEKIDENTEVSKQAFHEANDVNQKIANLAKAIDSVRRPDPSRG
jgi:hypothetical protein